MLTINNMYALNKSKNCALFNFSNIYKGNIHFYRYYNTKM